MGRPGYRKQASIRGFTLIELMIVVVIVAILAAMAIPGFADMIAKNKVKAAAEEIYGLILQAKSESPIRDRNVSVSIKVASDPWCVGLKGESGAPAYCDCTIADPTDASACELLVAGTNVLQVVNGSEHPDVTIDEDFTSSNFVFELPRMRLDQSPTPGAIEVINGDWQLNVAVDATGQISVCNPNSNSIPGYEECPP